MRSYSVQPGTYTTRMKIFVCACCLFLLVCLVRLTQMQLWPHPTLRVGVEELKEQWERSQQFQTLRGKILDRNGKVLATDEPLFSVQISYQLAQYADPRVIAAKKHILKQKHAESPPKLDKALAKLTAEQESLLRVWEKSGLFVTDMQELAQKIKSQNDVIWTVRSYQAWRNHCKDTALYQEHKDVISKGAVPTAAYLADLRQQFPDPNERFALIEKQRILEMNQYQPFFFLLTDEAVLTAQMEFADVNNVRIASQGRRVYPYEASAAHTIGWVGPATQDRDKALFEDDPLARYRPGEICGREDGVEYLCEPILRGRRGLESYDLDKVLVESVETKFGRNVTLTLDIELQKTIENYLLTYPHAPHCKPGMAVVLIDVKSTDILALVSLPSYDLNTVRQHWTDLLKDKENKPLLNRTLHEDYKPGSTAKPLVLACGLEIGAITPSETIPCPAEKAPPGWPSCWIFRKGQGGHDWQGENNARNAIRGSCNIYFSHLAHDRIPPLTLQKWFFAFGYGHQIPLPLIEEPDLPPGSPPYKRRLRQAPGKISTVAVPWYRVITDINEIPELHPPHRKLAGMGEGEIKATILQIANSMATLARNGLSITPRLFLPTPNQTRQLGARRTDPFDLDLSDTTLATVLEGMDAVVNEYHGTAYEAFQFSDFANQGVKAYGKTGSTEKPNNALFAGFASDNQGRAIAIALVVEGGESGSGDAAPLARDILQYCINYGYLGRQPEQP